MARDTEALTEVQRELGRLRSEFERAEGGTWDAIVAARSRSIVVSLDDYKIVRTSPLAEELFGYVPGELTGKSVHDLVPEALRKVHEGHVASFAAAPKPRLMGTGQMVLRGRRRDGTEIPLAIELFPVAKDGRLYVVAAIMTVRDTP